MAYGQIDDKTSKIFKVTHNQGKRSDLVVKSIYKLKEEKSSSLNSMEKPSFDFKFF